MSKPGFLKAHRLSLQKDIDSIFSEGNSSAEFPLRFKWIAKPSSELSWKLLISVPKKQIPHAVNRNLIKRRIRESFRIIEQETLQTHAAVHATIHLAVMYSHKEISVQPIIHKKLERGMKKIVDYVQNL